MTSVLRTTAAFTAHEKPVTGDIKMSFVNYDHLGWMMCDGRSLSFADFNLVFQVIGYTFGGSGDNFNLPDPMGKVTGSVNGTYPPGTDIGEALHTLTIAEMPSHNHSGVTSSAGTHTHTQTTVNDDFNNSGTYPNFSQPSYPPYDSAGSITWTSTINSAGAHTHTISSQGAGTPFNNIQPTLFIGNTFIYSGIPTYPGFPPAADSAWPYTTGLNPPLI